MKINSINSYYTPINNTKRYTPSFGLYCTEYEKELAKKYMFVKNPENAIRDEVDHSSRCAVVPDILEYIKLLLKQEDEKSDKIAGLNIDINKTDSDITSVNNRKEELTDEIEKANTITENKKKRLFKIVSREQRRLFVTSQLKENYLDLHKLDKKMYPGGIIIKNIKNIYTKKYIIDFLKKHDPNFMFVNFDKISSEDILGEMIKIKEKALKMEGHPLLCIENFRKHTTPTQRNFRFVNKLKGFISRCTEEGILTFLIFENHPEKLDNAINKGHRFGCIIDANDIRKEK